MSCGALARETVLEARVDGGRAPRTFRLLRCPQCGLVMTSPRLGRSELEEFYRPDYWGRVNADDLRWVRRDQEPRTSFLERFRKGGRILDVGCGLGLFLLALHPARWDRYGIEVMPAASREEIEESLTYAPESAGRLIASARKHFSPLPNLNLKPTPRRGS